MTLVASLATPRNPRAVEDVLVASVARYTLEGLLDSKQRKQHREQCSRRLKSQDGAGDIKYADQAILANLDWGIDALDEAIQTPNTEARNARLEHAEKMLHVCGLLDLGGTTAGVPNSYLAAWAHLNLAYVWKLRSDDRNAARHMLEMFLADAFYSRVDFAPALWEYLFQPHLVGIATWYCEQRTKLLLPSSQAASLDESLDYSFSRDDCFSYSVDQVALNNVCSKVTAEQLQVLEQLYQNSLDDHTRQYARYYKELLNFCPDVSSSKRVVAPMMPIAEPPMTPLRDPAPSSSSELALRRRELDKIQEDDHDDCRNESARSDGGSSSLDYEIDSKEVFPEPLNLRLNVAASGEPKQQRALPVKASDLHVVDLKARKHGSRSSSFSLKSDLDEASPRSPSGSAEPRKQKEKKTTRSSSFRSPRESLVKKPKGLIKSVSRRLYEIFEEHKVQIPSPRATSSSSSGYATETDSDTEVDSRRNVKTEEHQLASEAGQTTGNSSTELSRDEAFGEKRHERRRMRPPKDFVCPITNQLFIDPVTLETGQTYERRAIQEWVDRGNTSCPITRQRLLTKTLPHTNYVLKRLVESWKDQHPGYPSESPLSVPTPCTSEILNNDPGSPSGGTENGECWLSELKPATTSLCTFEDLEECESAILTIACIWDKSQGHAKVEASLTKAGVIEGLVEVLSLSVIEDVQRAAVNILSALVSSEEFTRHAILRADPDVECVVRLIKKGLSEAVVLLYQLNISVDQLSRLDLVPNLVGIIKNEGNTQEGVLLRPKTVAVILLEQLVSLNGSSEGNYPNASTVISLEGVPVLTQNLGAEDMEERLSTLSILLCCIKADGRCRSLVASTAQLRHVVEVLVSGHDSARFLATQFFSNCILLNRRVLNNKILNTVKHGGVPSAMHVLLAYLQNATPEHRSLVANFILQLDLLNEPRQFSIYAEEAVEALVSALKDRDTFHLQVEAANVLVSLGGRFSYSGRPLTEAWLLKTAGLEHAYDAFMNEETQMVCWDESVKEEEEKAANAWERNAALALLGYDNGTVLEALGINLQCNNSELSRPCMVAAVWLSRMVKVLPNFGLRPIARRSFLASFLVLLESAHHNQQRALAALGLHTFLDDPESFQELLPYAKDIVRPLRQLKKVSWIGHEFLQAFIKSKLLNPTDVWQHEEIGQVDVSRSGEVRALTCCKGRLFSGHSDGTIQVWETKKKVPALLVVLKEHIKGVTCLSVPSPSNRLYSGSLDKTVRVWAIAPDSIHCINTIDIKEVVCGVSFEGSILCVATQNGGIKVHSADFSTKHLNSSKNVQCLAMANGKIYCGCTDHSIQEINPLDGSVLSIQSGTRTLLGKKPVYAIEAVNDEIISAGVPVEGASVKVWSRADRSLLRVVPTTADIRSLAVNNDFLYLGSASGFLEIWLKEQLVKVSALAIGSKVNGLVVDGETLYSGSDDGKIKAWSFV